MLILGTSLFPISVILNLHYLILSLETSHYNTNDCTALFSLRVLRCSCLGLCAVISSGKKVMWQSSSGVFLISSLCFAVLPTWKNDTTSQDNCGLSFSEYREKKDQFQPTSIEKKKTPWREGIKHARHEGKVYLGNVAILLWWQLERVKAIPRVNNREINRNGRAHTQTHTHTLRFVTSVQRNLLLLDPAWSGICTYHTVLRPFIPFRISELWYSLHPSIH
jgi:hypothetical protein